MAIQRTGTVSVVDPDDLQSTYRGITWALKFREIPGMDAMYIEVLVKQPSGAWNNDNYQPEAKIENDFSVNILNYDSFNDWWNNKVLVNLNKFLTRAFPPLKPGEVVDPPTVPTNASEQFFVAFNMSKAIKLTYAENGTVTAS